MHTVTGTFENDIRGVLTVGMDLIPACPKGQIDAHHQVVEGGQFCVRKVSGKGVFLSFLCSLS